jgi:hypothetical protein
MTSGTITPDRTRLEAGRDGFAQLLRAEWTKTPPALFQSDRVAKR